MAGYGQYIGWYERAEIDSYHGVSDSNVSNAAEEDKSKASGLISPAGWTIRGHRPQKK
jgi:hypothetical protein